MSEDEDRGLQTSDSEFEVWDFDLEFWGSRIAA